MLVFQSCRFNLKKNVFLHPLIISNQYFRKKNIQNNFLILLKFFFLKSLKFYLLSFIKFNKKDKIKLKRTCMKSPVSYSSVMSHDNTSRIQTVTQMSCQLLKRPDNTSGVQTVTQ